MSVDARLKLLGFLVSMVVLHFALRIGLGLGTLAPDLLVVGFLVYAREAKPGTAAGIGVLLGLLDGSVTYTVGASSLVLAVLGYLASRSRDAIASDGLVLMAFYLLAGKWAYDVLLWGVTVATAHASPASSLIVFSLPAALYAAAAGVAAVMAYRAVA
ncbi:MAG: rod shape-determining protein MreD [Gemmatimonadetes bacterium]|nr:rod shape-determining protein MreD [Gemmatimonadota bacterium]